MIKFEGVMPALVTPLNADDTLNAKALESLLDLHLSQNAEGFYIGGATGESFALTREVRRELAERSIAHIGKRANTIVHIAASAFNDTIELAKHAEAAGADALSAVPPIFFKYDENDVYNYYKAIANAVHIPIMVYYSPNANFPITSKFAARLFREIDNITGIKWTSSNYYDMMNLKDLTNGEMNIINGPDEMLLMGLNAGADGGIGSTYNVMLPLYQKILACFRAGDVKGAQETQHKVNRVIRVLLDYNVIPAVKVLLEAMGQKVGEASFPFPRYSAETKAKIIAEAKAAGFEF